MAKHLSQQLREAIEAALLGLPSTGDRVFTTRAWPVDEASYPALLIWDKGGPSEFGSMAATDAARDLDRREDVVIEILVLAGGDEKSKPTLGDRLDAIRTEVEPAMMGDAGIGALVDERELIDTTKDWAVEGDARRGSCRLTYRCLYTTPAGDPTTRS